MTTGTAADGRLAKLRAELESENLDALLVSNASNRRYLSGFTGSSGSLLITADGATIATDFRYYEQAESQAEAFRLYKTAGRLDDWLPGLLDGMGGKRTGFEASEVSYALHRQMVAVIEAMPAAARPRLVPRSGIVERLRARKDADELAKLQAAIDLGDATFEHVAKLVEPGWSEQQVAWEIERYIHEQGGDGPSFSAIVAGGAWGAMPHAYARDHALKSGEGLVIDMGARLDGYCSDLTRTIVLGEPDARFRAVYEIVLTAQLAAYEMIEPGMTGAQAHMLAQSVIDAAGYGEHFGHGLGHGIGLQVHEAPRVTATSDDTLEEGMVFSIEPGIYLPGWGGVRIEDLAVVERGRCRFLSHAPKSE
ncbi:MAG TPA: Xaa-Pro peptidase family protein [Dehalococcoidia bacterium]|nr:Xaa-Pro peptidase family protein [Dehalococcoidia bacterium]